MQAQYTNPPTRADPFAHLAYIPLFQIYSHAEVEALRRALEQNAETKKIQHEFAKNIPPPLSTTDQITLKVISEYISAMGDGGSTLMLSKFNINKIMASSMGVLDAMEQKMMQDNQIIRYYRFATYAGTPGPQVIVDILAYHSYSNPEKNGGVQVRSNVPGKFKLCNKYELTLTEGKDWKKTWFRGRFHTMSVAMVGSDGKDIELGQVVCVERGVSPNASTVITKEWNAYRVPKLQ